EAFTAWRRVPLRERAATLSRLADVVEAHSEEWARLMTAEMGKPIAAARAEIEKCAWVCRYYAEAAPGMLADHHIEADRSRSYVHHEPLGVVL
ncbi:MAG: aldehyde dehydrogenase family protein, partial [Actinobacteria bacterium]|nr:aldehyde dehydrogenase family protein [Actinomycetota bacterium]